MLGVALEVFFVIWEYLEERHDFLRGIVHPPEKPRILLFGLGLVGAALVAVGVSGEYVKASQIATTETCIRQGNETLFLLLSKEAQSAKSSAEGAEASAKVAKRESQEAGDTAKTAVALSDSARGVAKAVAKDVAAIKQQVAWRILTTECNQALKDGLRPLGVQKIDFFINATDPEITFLAQQIGRDLIGWPVEVFEPVGVTSVSGLLIEYDPRDPRSVKRAQLITEVLSSTVCRQVARSSPSLPTPKSQLPGIMLGRLGGNPDSTVRLTVGNKPPPSL